MRGKNEVGLSAFAFLFSELIQYSQQRVNTGEELERKCVRRRHQNGRTTFSPPPFLFVPCPLYLSLTARASRLVHFFCRLEEAGLGIGHRALELGCFREKSSKRETRMLGILQFITGVVWKMLFGSTAKDNCSLEKSVDQDDEFMIVEKQPLVTTYISTRDAPCACAAFVAGIVRGVLDGAQFPARVTAHEEDSRTVILIKFKEEVLDRENRIS